MPLNSSLNQKTRVTIENSESPDKFHGMEGTYANFLRSAMKADGVPKTRASPRCRRVGYTFGIAVLAKIVCFSRKTNQHVPNAGIRCVTLATCGELRSRYTSIYHI